MRARTLGLATAVLLPLALGLAACGGSDSDAAASGHFSFGPPSVSPTDVPTDLATDMPTDLPTDVPTDLPTDEPSASWPALPPGVTKPGTQLKIGDTAIVDYYPAGPKRYHGLMRLRLDSVDKGSPADLKSLDLGDQAAGQVPYYARWTVTGGQGSHALSFSVVSAADFDALLPDGSRAEPIITMAKWDTCDPESGFLPKDFGPGRTLKVCMPYLAGQGTRVDSVTFSQGGSPYDLYGGKPIVWK